MSLSLCYTCIYRTFRHRRLIKARRRSRASIETGGSEKRAAALTRKPAKCYNVCTRGSGSRSSIGLLLWCVRWSTAIGGVGSCGVPRADGLVRTVQVGVNLWILLIRCESDDNRERLSVRVICRV